MIPKFFFTNILAVIAFIFISQRGLQAMKNSDAYRKSTVKIEVNGVHVCSGVLAVSFYPHSDSGIVLISARKCWQKEINEKGIRTFKAFTEERKEITIHNVQPYLREDLVVWDPITGPIENAVSVAGKIPKPREGRAWAIKWSWSSQGGTTPKLATVVDPQNCVIAPEQAKTYLCAHEEDEKAPEGNAIGLPLFMYFDSDPEEPVLVGVYRDFVSETKHHTYVVVHQDKV